MDWVLLTTRSPVDAQLLAGALTTEGLRVRVERNALSTVYGHNTFAARVLVHPDDVDAARALLMELDAPEY